MNSVKDILSNIPKTTGTPSDKDIMLDPEYLRNSSSIISEALKKGFDVLQLENGDIVTTGTKIVVTQYRWDEKKGGMVRLSSKERKKAEEESQKNN